MKRTTLILFCLLGFFAACQQSQSKEAGAQEQTEAPTVLEVLSVADFSVKIKDTPNAQLIDVRTPQEYADGHIDGSTNINVNDDSFDASIQQALKKDQPVLVYCQAGSRSARAAKRLKEMGFKEVYDLEGGYGAWSEQ